MGPYEDKKINDVRQKKNVWSEKDDRQTKLVASVPQPCRLQFAVQSTVPCLRKAIALIYSKNKKKKDFRF